MICVSCFSTIAAGGSKQYHDAKHAIHSDRRGPHVCYLHSCDVFRGAAHRIIICKNYSVTMDELTVPQVNCLFGYGCGTRGLSDKCHSANEG